MTETEKKIKRGFRFWDFLGQEYRVMAVADGYAMFRRPGYVPNVWTIKAIAKQLDNGGYTYQWPKPPTTEAKESL